MQEGEEREQEIGKLFEKIMKGNRHTSSGNTESQIKWMQESPLQDTS